MLAVDLRGTGGSTPLDCPSLQNWSGATGGAAFRGAVAACGAELDHRWKTSSGSWVHASDLFTSAPAAEDVAAVVRALGLARVDVYGDSYGSWFAQVFAARYPSLVRSLTLDSTYAVQGLDPWYRSTLQAMPADFDTACADSPACAAAAPGSSWARIGALALRLRRHPVGGTVPGPQGSDETVTMNVVGLVDLVNDAAGDPDDLPRAGRLGEGPARPGRPRPAAAPLRPAPGVRRGLLPRAAQRLLGRPVLRGLVPRRPAALRHGRPAGGPDGAVGGGQAGAPVGHLRPLHHRRVAEPGREHRGLLGLHLVAHADRRPAGGDRGPAVPAPLRARADPGWAARHVDASLGRPPGAGRARRPQPVHRGGQLDPRGGGGGHELRRFTGPGVRDRPGHPRLARRLVRLPGGPDPGRRGLRIVARRPAAPGGGPGEPGAPRRAPPRCGGGGDGRGRPGPVRGHRGCGGPRAARRDRNDQCGWIARRSGRRHAGARRGGERHPHRHRGHRQWPADGDRDRGRLDRGDRGPERHRAGVLAGLGHRRAGPGTRHVRGSRARRAAPPPLRWWCCPRRWSPSRWRPVRAPGRRRPGRRRRPQPGCRPGRRTDRPRRGPDHGTGAACRPAAAR